MRCVWCVRTHVRRLFSIVEKSEEIEPAGIHVLPIEDIVMDYDEWEADGREAPL